MKYYKDMNNKVFAYELDGSQDHLIGDKVLMTAEEVELHINPPKTEEQIIAEKVIEYKAYLANTDYIVTKIAEAQALGEDTTLLLSKYEVELQQRKEARTFVGANS
jgi:hypothetical protein